ncbi:MAG: glutamate--tRNA ligase [Pseudomonadota bacterium]
MTVTTRFAPSPTGMLHIGGARTALFNLLYARRHKGRFLLRVEDTDRERSTPEAVEAILEGLSWLNITSDAPPVFQAEQADRHVKVAEEMMARGTAFRCYTTQDELQTRRQLGEDKRAAAKADGLSDNEKQTLLAEADAALAPFRSPWREGGEAPSPDAPYTVRLKAPDTGSITIADAVQGEISIQASEIDDLVLLRADGTPTYMLAVVVDDHDMAVTHVIRGDDHLRNAFRQKPIYEAMGWDVPVFAHVPLIHGPDGAKLSKRHGATSVTEYRDQGYLSEAVCNYLLRLGWSHGDQEIFSMEEAGAVFSLDAIGKSPARLDFDKLAAVNGHYIRQADPARLLPLVLAQIEEMSTLTPEARARIAAALPDLVDRGDTIPALAEACAFLSVERPIELNKKARKSLKGEGLDRLAIIRDEFAQTEPWSVAELHQTLEQACDRNGLSLGQIGPPLRAALTGNRPAPEIEKVLEWLGRGESLARIDDQLANASATEANET